MNQQEQEAILVLSLMAAFADGHKDEAERAELKRIADALAGEGSINLARCIRPCCSSECRWLQLWPR
jgi:uncharacterized membrane protein YebE (DUF533 family)